jgi:porin
MGLAAAVLLALLIIAPPLIVAQESRSEESQAAQPDETKSGYEDLPGFGGPGSVQEQLEKDDEAKKTLFRFDALKRALEPYFDFKERAKERNGFAFGFDYSATYHSASDSLGEDDAGSGMVRLFGTWEVLGRGTDNTGSIVYKFSHRHRLGTDVPLNGLASQIGYAGIIGGPYSNQQWRLTNLYWSQRNRKGRLNFVAGWVDATDYLDVYALANPWMHFLNLAFSTGSSSIPVPNEGLGAALGAMLTDKMYLIAGLADSNSDPHAPGEGFDTFFDDHEFFEHIELGWISSFDRRYFDNTHVTLWHADEREEALVPDGWGANFSFSRFVNDTWMPFVRAGYADDGGSLLEKSITLGYGYYVKRRSDLFGIALNWGEPNESTFAPGLDDQYTTEIFYRLQLSENTAITPNLQYVVDPALNPNEDSILILGLRARVAL